MKKILIIAGHPDPAPERLSNALARAYEVGARATGNEVRFLQLGSLTFDPILHRGYAVRQELEPDLLAAQESLTWADHIVLCYPTWWGGLPAFTKGFLDRCFLSGFAFKYHKDSPFWDKLFKGKSARIITTMDAPVWYYRLFFGAPGDHMLRNAILGFSGIRPIRFTHLGSTRFSTPDTRAKWLRVVEHLGTKD